MSEFQVVDILPTEVWYEKDFLGTIRGNKRCPRATDHNLPCTNSNEPGQEGSRY